MFKKRLLSLCIAAIAAFTAIGCSTPQSSNKETVIPKSPKRIVDISGNSDILSILGYQVIGTANSDAYDYTKFPSYLEKTLEGAAILGYSMQDTMDIEGIIALQPDLIIISKVQEKMYNQLSDVAPTIMLEMAQMDWREDVRTVASAFDKTETAENWLGEYSEKAKKAGEKLKETYGNETTYLALLASGGQIFIFNNAGVGSILYQDMGLQKPAGMPEQSDISLPVVTYEGLASIDPDYILAIGTDDDLKTLESNSLWKNMNAVKSGNYTTLPASPYFNIGYSSIGRSVFLEEINGIMEQIHD